MSTVIKINDVALAPIDYRGLRVMTLAMMDIVHKRADGTAGRNFRENRERLIEGEDFHKVCVDEIRAHKIFAISSKAREDVILLTETGYAMVVKSFTDDLAWDVQRQLVKSYFRPAAKAPASAQARVPVEPGLAALRAAKAIESKAKVAGAICAAFPQLGEAAKQTIFAKLVNAAAGQDVIPLPVVENLLSATAVGAKFKVSANAIGKLANAHGLKIEAYGEYAMDKSQHSEKQMPSFRYNAAGVVRIGELLRAQAKPAEPQGTLSLIEHEGAA